MTLYDINTVLYDFLHETTFGYTSLTTFGYTFIYRRFEDKIDNTFEELRHI